MFLCMCVWGGGYCFKDLCICILAIWVFCLHVCMCTTHMSAGNRSQKRVSHPWMWKGIWVVVRHHVTLCKSSKWASPLSHLSSPRNLTLWRQSGSRQQGQEPERTSSLAANTMEKEWTGRTVRLWTLKAHLWQSPPTRLSPCLLKQHHQLGQSAPKPVPTGDIFHLNHYRWTLQGEMCVCLCVCVYVYVVSLCMFIVCVCVYVCVWERERESVCVIVWVWRRFEDTIIVLGMNSGD